MFKLNEALTYAALDEAVRCHELVITQHRYGSRYVCPELATEDTDEDWIILVNDIIEVTNDLCTNHEFTYDENEDYERMDNRLRSLRKGRLNVVLTEDADLFEKATTATELCKHLKLTKRADRIFVHEIIERGLRFDPAFGWS